MRYCKLKFFFCLLKIFSQFVEKIEKLELSLSKQHNKMLKIRSETLKIIKNVNMINAENHKKCQNFLNPGNPEDFRNPGKLKIWEEEKP